MSADKRTTHTDALETLGFILADNQGERDAIHLAVEPVIAATTLSPGEHVGIKDGKAVSGRFRKNKDVKMLGIVDPFLKMDIVAGEKFWLVVYPRQITSLRHVWAHPDFDEESYVMFPNVDGTDNAVLYPSPKELAYKWIQDYANRLSGSYYDYRNDSDSYADITAEELIETAKTHLDGGWGDFIVYGGMFEGEYTEPEFWNQLEIYLEKEIPEVDRRSFFSCSC